MTATPAGQLRLTATPSSCSGRAPVVRRTSAQTTGISAPTMASALSIVFAGALAALVPREPRPGLSAWYADHAQAVTADEVVRDAVLLFGTGWLDSPLWSLQWEVLFSLLLPLYLLVALAAAAVARQGRWPVRCRGRLLSTPRLLWLGTRSFSLYLVHEPIVVSFAVLLPSMPVVAHLLIVLPVSLVVAHAFHRGVEAPAHRTARRFARRGRPHGHEAAASARPR